MWLLLGDRRIDVTSRCAVVGLVGQVADVPAAELSGRGARLAALGADAVEVAAADDAPDLTADVVRALAAQVPCPIVVSSPSSAMLAASLDAGAVGVHGPDGLLDAAFAELCARRRVTIFAAAAGRAAADLAVKAAEFGIEPGRLVIDVGATRWPMPGSPCGPMAVLACSPLERGAPGATIASTAAAIRGGCRVIRTADVRGARRVAEVVGALVGARA